MNAPARPFHESKERAKAPDHPLSFVLSEAQDLFRRGEFAKANERLIGFSEHVARASESLVYGERPAKPTASVVVVSYRHNNVVETALDAIAQQCPVERWEIILVDNGNSELFETGTRHLAGFVGVKPPFPLGCSGGRNLGVAHATSDTVLFLDDDGVMEPGCAQALISSLKETDAVAARGKVIPLTKRGAPHYDLGAERIPSFIDCEGVSAWRRMPFLEQGGFHPLLAGHEGIELCARLWRHYGPLAFVYEPSAVLRHEYAPNEARAADKKKQLDINRALVEFGDPQTFDIHVNIQGIALSGRQLYLSTSGLRMPRPAGGPAVSIITTARNARPFLEEFSACWKRQSQRDFQLVFVDDGSEDGTSDIVRDLWKGDDRLSLIAQPFKGRGAALNAAFAAAAHDICLIADVDDLSIPSRIARTVDFFGSNPEQDFLSFVAFNELDLFRIGPPASPFVSDMAVRSLFHMPASFPTFACRRQRFTEAFDETLKAGVDCDWLHRNMAAADVRGQLIHYPTVYYRRHENQITRHYNDIQWEARERLIHYAFSRVLGPLSEADKNFIKLLVDIRKAPRPERRKLGAWVMNLLRQNDSLGVYPRDVLRPVLLDAFERVKQLPSEDEKIRSLRLKAEQHIESGQYKLARKVLRHALRIRDDPEVRTRLLGANRFGIVRALSRSQPFRTS